MHTAEDNQVTIAVHEHFSQLVKLQVTFAVSKLLLTFWSTVHGKSLFQPISIIYRPSIKIVSQIFNTLPCIGMAPLPSRVRFNVLQTLFNKSEAILGHFKLEYQNSETRFFSHWSLDNNETNILH